MNRNIIIALAFITVGIIVFLSISKDVSTYASFEVAEKSGQTSILNETVKIE